jgi:hypothetical protein
VADHGHRSRASPQAQHFPWQVKYLQPVSIYQNTGDVRAGK